MDSLRYWVLEMHVDGFRFDLASTLARELHEVDRLGAFFDIIHQDPVLSQVKLIAEPWDLGEGGYQVGNFPVLWTEWNGKYRDTVRSFWRGDGGTVSEFATRLCGSSDLYEHNGRKPYASINFVTSHDGFSLRDLVSYNHKHNEANGHNNEDGDNHNLSWNCGEEGPTDDAEVLHLRHRQLRNFLATLMLSQGVPMIRGGDELGHTQGGNNNAYCQDNEISWIDWDLTPPQQELLEFVCRVVRLRNIEPVLTRRQFFQGRQIRGAGATDLTWFSAGGREMKDADWDAPHVRVLGVKMNGKMIDEEDERGRPILGTTVLLLFNADDEEILFTMPETAAREYWKPLFDTSGDDCDGHRFLGQSRYHLHSRSLAVFELRRRQPKLLGGIFINRKEVARQPATEDMESGTTDEEAPGPREEVKRTETAKPEANSTPAS
jgi:glycogen operon protein